MGFVTTYTCNNSTRSPLCVYPLIFTELEWNVCFSAWISPQYISYTGYEMVYSGNNCNTKQSS